MATRVNVTPANVEKSREPRVHVTTKKVNSTIIMNYCNLDVLTCTICVGRQSVTYVT